MTSFLAGLLETFKDGLRCRQYLKIEAARMLYMLHAYYSQEDCLKFFAQILSPDMKFSEFVRINWMKYSTIKELAGGIYMTQQQFSNRFRKIFGTTPHEWITRQKSQKIYQDICRSDVTFKEISEKYDFSSQSNFFHFCKHAFGSTPGQIRKSLKYKPI
jgi:AraC-like DNA-binding protein